MLRKKQLLVFYLEGRGGWWVGGWVGLWEGVVAFGVGGVGEIDSRSGGRLVGLTSWRWGSAAAAAAAGIRRALVQHPPTR